MLKSVEYLNLASKEWSKGPDLPHQLYSAASVVIDGKFIVLGGYDSEIAHDKIYQLEMGKGWKELKQKLKFGRSEHTAGVVRARSIGC